MPILVVADEFPWPPVNGSRIRLATHVEALCELTDVELLCVCDRPDPDDRVAPRRTGLTRVEVVDRAPITRSWRDTAGWLGSDRPRELRWRSWDHVRRHVRSWAAPRYDLVWFADVASYLALHDLVEGPVIVDFDDLESWKLRHRRTAGRSPATGATGAVRAILAAGADRLDERRWHRVEQDVAARVARVLVCSELDRARLGAPNATVVPNGYPAPEAAARAVGTDRPVLLFVGLLTYPPNVDAAGFLADVVLPAVRRRVPEAELRLVGRTGPEVDALGDRPGVTVVGRVDDLAPELAGAAVAVAPIRFGGGTRIKILEAFAHGIPVVTTTVGCEGLDVEPGRHLLIGDDPQTFAAACVRLLLDPARRRELASAASARFEERYRSDRVAAAVQAVARPLLAPGSARP
jgi:glycosyltransferase involved in cell wall biosynthesis